MSDRYKIKAPLGPTFNTNPDDVWVVKKSLARSGFYKTPDYGMTPYPDEELFAGIRKFQRRYGLKADGQILPNGQTETEMKARLAASPSYRCIHCVALHGGVYSPKVCWQCWNKGMR